MFRLLMGVYSLLYTVGVLVYLPFLLYRRIVEGKRAHLLQRAGRGTGAFPGAGFLSNPSPARLWIHAVSVGEVNAIKPLVDALTLSTTQLWISTTTEAGQTLARKLFESKAKIFYFPLDWKWVCRRYLRKIRPAAVLLAETEIWPGFIMAASSLGVPVILVNGRISDRSFRRYRRITFFLPKVLGRVDSLCMQSRQDKERILRLGAPAGRVRVVGNLKYDYRLMEDPEKTRLIATLSTLLKPNPDDLLWLCGSTREGEEELVLDAFAALRSDFPGLKLLLAPRHPHRSDLIAQQIQGRRLSCIRRSHLNGHGAASAQQDGDRPDVLLLDTIGELSYLYQLADVVFMGGSLVRWGGHNIIEAAYFGKPILFGPHMQNFREISSAFLESYAALQVQSAGELVTKVRELLKDPAARNWLGRNARKVVRDNQGAVQRTLQVVFSYL